MTVTTTASAVTVQGNGSTTTFSYSFEIPATSGGSVYAELVYTDTTGNQVTLAQNLWSITGLGTSGGTFTYPLSGSPIAANTSLTLTRALPATQQVALGNQGYGFNVTTIESVFDYLTMLIQDVINGPTPQFPATTGIANADSPYTIQPTDAIIWAHTATGAITINAPEVPINGQVFTVVDADNDAAANNVTIGFAIGPNATPTITANGGGLKFAYNGSAWSFVP